jgi:hypothetical protein
LGGEVWGSYIYIDRITHRRLTVTLHEFTNIEVVESTLTSSSQNAKEHKIRLWRGPFHDTLQSSS